MMATEHQKLAAEMLEAITGRPHRPEHITFSIKFYESAVMLAQAAALSLKNTPALMTIGDGAKHPLATARSLPRRR